MTGIKSVGFNQWDEQWVNQQMNAQGEYNSTPRISSKNFIKILGNTSYILSVQRSGLASTIADIHFYDSSKVHISYVAVKNGQVFTTPSNAKYARFSMYAFYGTSSSNTYGNDICINISIQSKNGTYKAYEETTKSIPVTTLTGKLNGTGNNVVVFPDGMKKINNVYDEIKIENGVVKAIKRVGSVDLGSLTWTLNTSWNWFQSQVLTNSAYYESSSYQYIMSVKYRATTDYQMRNGVQDKKMAVGRSGSTYGRRVIVRDSDYTDAATFKTAMNGVMLYYKLATEQEYILDESLPKDL